MDVACGTGVLARGAAARVGPEGFGAGVDPDSGMLAVAESLAPTVEWRHGTAESLRYPDHAFDAVVSQFGLMFFTDHRGAHGFGMRKQGLPADIWIKRFWEWMKAEKLVPAT